MNIKNATDEELQQEYLALWENIERTEIWGGSDFKLKESIAHELEGRGYKIYEEANVAFIKDDEE